MTQANGAAVTDSLANKMHSKFSTYQDTPLYSVPRFKVSISGFNSNMTTIKKLNTHIKWVFHKHTIIF